MTGLRVVSDAFKAALERGDNVVATARNLESATDLKKRFGGAVLPLQLDLTDTARVPVALQEAFNYLGLIDVLVDNAGSSLGLLGLQQPRCRFAPLIGMYAATKVAAESLVRSS